MKRKPTLGLQLLPLLPPPPSPSPSPSPNSSEFCSDHGFPRTCSSTINHITIFYNAPLRTCDTSELQALAILWHARVQEELEAKYNNKVNSESNLNIPPNASLHFQMHGPYFNGLSLKKSLQKFLQNRRDRRIQAASPYTKNLERVVGSE